VSGLTPGQLAIFAPPNLAYLATVSADGSPHLSPLWADTRDGMIVLNTAEGRTKVGNVRRDPRVAVAIHDQARPHPPVAVLGTVVEITSEGALEHIDTLSRRYTGEPWTPHEGQTRLLLVIRPDRVLGWT
jgi:PPOX class probable F420-dependent enzyme